MYLKIAVFWCSKEAVVIFCDKVFTLLCYTSGGIFGSVSVLVRTVGGGEDWTSQIVPKPGASGNDTITEILGNRDRFTSATGGTDYVVLDTVVTFEVWCFSNFI